jgi:succinate-semialdehyde dehydrogenase / glutarate-semialdehyde dehydrogenase
MSLHSVNPYNNLLIKEFEEYGDEKLESMLTSSEESFNRWKKTSFDKRKSLMEKAAALLRRNSLEYASAITSEMGKPIRESIAEVEKCAWVCDYYAEYAERFLQTENVTTDADTSYISYEPLGTVLGIMPWNFPFWQVFRFAVPTLMAGNTVFLKHASNVQICAQNIENIFLSAGFPETVFRNLVLGSQKMEKIIRHDSIKAVSLTGSEEAGKKVSGIAAVSLKKCVLELGGSNAFIVLDDADLQKAAETGIKARFQNAGQSCIAAKRFIISRRVSTEFIDKFVTGIRKLKRGDPSDENTEIGPLSSIQQAEKVVDQVNRSEAMGAKLIEGGKREGAFYTPAVVTGVKPGMPLFDEEAFGPVAAITIASGTEEAIELAGNTTFGLGVSLFTGDIEKGKDLVNKFHDGAVFINGLVKSDPRLPFGGTRRSGYGRELYYHGIREFVNVKSVWIKK